MHAEPADLHALTPEQRFTPSTSWSQCCEQQSPLATQSELANRQFPAGTWQTPAGVQPAVQYANDVVAVKDLRLANGDQQIAAVAEELHNRWDRDRHLESPTVHEGDVNPRTGYFRISYPHCDGLRAAREAILRLRYLPLNRLELARRIDAISSAIPPLNPAMPKAIEGPKEV